MRSTREWLVTGPKSWPKKMIKKIALTLFIFLLLPQIVLAQFPQEETLEVKVVNILEEKKAETPQGKQIYQKLECLVAKGSLKDQTISIEHGKIPAIGLPRYKEGEQLVVTSTQDLFGNQVFYITDYVRRIPLFWLFLIFIVLTLIVARTQGLTSLLGMAISFLVIFKFILPRILAGADPITTSILGSIVIIPPAFYLSHGLNKKTTVAIGGTLIALVITGLLANTFIETAKLTGFASEEASFLQVARQGAINIKGLLLAGIIISVLGVLDDVTVSQAAIAWQLKQANPKIKSGELYKRGMAVGKDHIASMVNTLILVYTGAALPLLLLFVNNSHPFEEVINYEIVAEEIVKTLVGSIGLILAVPTTTMLAAWAVKNSGHKARTTTHVKN